MGLISRVSSRTYRFFRAITMPILNIDTNSDKVIDQNDLLKLTQAVATTLNKPTSKVLIKVNKMTMSFGGSTEAAAYVNLRSKGNKRYKSARSPKQTHTPNASAHSYASPQERNNTGPTYTFALASPVASISRFKRATRIAQSSEPILL